MEHTTPTHQPYFTPTGQLTPAGRDAISAIGAAIRKSITMEPTTDPDTSDAPSSGVMSLCCARTAPTGYDAIRLAMAAQFKLQLGHTPIDLRRKGSAMEPTTPTYQACEQLAADLAVALRPIGLAARRAVANLAPLAAALLDAQRGPTIGRKRRRRRARGRARERA